MIYIFCSTMKIQKRFFRLHLAWAFVINLLLPSMAIAHSTSLRHLFDELTSKFDTKTLVEARQQAAHARINDQTAWENPQVQYGVGGAKVGSFHGKYNELFISQNVTISGAKSQLGQQWNDRETIVNLEGLQLTNKINGDILRMIFTHLYNLERSNHTRERLQRLSLISTYLQKKKFASPRDLVENAQIANRIKNLRLEVIQIEKDLERSTAYFASLAPDTTIDQVAFVWPQISQLETTFNQYMKNQSSVAQIQQAENNIHASQIEIAKRKWIPDLRFYYMRTYQDQYLADPNINDAMGVGISVPLFHVGSNARVEARAQALSRKIEQTQENTLRNTRLVDLRGRFTLADATLKEFNDNYLKLADRQLIQATNHFRGGLITASSFLDLEDQVHNSIHLVSKNKLDIISILLETIETNNIQVSHKDLFL